MKKIMLRIIMILLIAMIFVSSMSVPTFCNLADNYSGEKSSANTGIETVINMILAALQIICSAGAAAMLMWMGAKYMLASASERADLKKNLIQYAIGAVVMFASGQILGILKNFVDKSLGTK